MFNRTLEQYAMGCEDQKILLEIYKLHVASYYRAVKTLREATTMSADQYLRCSDSATEELAGCFAILRSLNDHIQAHGCRLELRELLCDSKFDAD
jgi:hypothetical protein